MEEQVKAVATKGRSSASPRATAQTINLSQVRSYDNALKRVSSGMSEFDRVLGGGIVYGSVVLIGGEPGIGKSTLLTHLFLNLAQNQSGQSILYIAGEESPEQILLRVDRMSGNHSGKWKEAVNFSPSTDVDEICNLIEQEKPSLLIVDSIQSLSTGDLSGATGSIGQLKECTERITRIVKRYHIPTFLVGHVTKDGAIAGPKVLEHIVDAVLELSGERTGAFRLLRAIKNRFGATDEVGVFQVVDTGLAEVSNPSQVFLEEKLDGVPGSCLTCVMEGTRPILVEIQALVVPSQLAMPRRVARGISLPRLQLLAAVLQKHCNLPLGTADIFVNVAGGFTITEPAADLAVAIAIASSQKNLATKKSVVCIGELGLLGEVRKVGLIEKRINESKRLGFKTAISSTGAPTLKVALSQAFGHK
jgi:DNA repair protein RadA/Sms